MSNPQILLQELTQLARNTGGELPWFADRMRGLGRISPQPHSLPACAMLGRLDQLANANTRNAVQAIIDTAPALRWQQSYTEADGFERHYLDNYGWFNLVSPDGVFTSDDIRVSVGYWGAGLSYLEHWHQPEEFYLVLAGSAEFHSAGRPPRRCSPGDVVHHTSNQKHAIEMTPGPLLVAAFWRGDGLLAKPDL